MKIFLRFFCDFFVFCFFKSTEDSPSAENQKMWISSSFSYSFAYFSSSSSLASAATPSTSTPVNLMRLKRAIYRQTQYSTMSAAAVLTAVWSPHLPLFGLHFQCHHFHRDSLAWKHTLTSFRRTSLQLYLCETGKVLIFYELCNTHLFSLNVD